MPARSKEMQWRRNPTIASNGPSAHARKRRRRQRALPPNRKRPRPERARSRPRHRPNRPGTEPDSTIRAVRRPPLAAMAHRDVDPYGMTVSCASGLGVFRTAAKDPLPATPSVRANSPTSAAVASNCGTASVARIAPLEAVGAMATSSDVGVQQLQGRHGCRAGEAPVRNRMTSGCRLPRPTRLERDRRRLNQPSP